MYGGQPVFHCRNVVQVNEWRSDGYEDDDENYLDDSIYDEDTCYSECPMGATLDQDSGILIDESPNRIKIDLDDLMEQTDTASSSNGSSENDNQLKLDYSGRFTQKNECLFNLNKSNADHISLTTSNKLFFLIFVAFYSVFNTFQ